MISSIKNKFFEFKSNKDLLTLWMNNLLVLYAFMLPISQTIKATIFSIILILFILRGDVVEYVKNSLKNPVVKAFLYLFIAYLIGMLWSEDLKEGLSALKSIKYGLYLIVFYSFIDGRYINKVISAFIIGMLISELTSYGMIFGIMPWKLEIGNILFYTAPSIGDPSPFLNHIHYGVALTLVVILLAHKLVYSDENIILKIFMSFFVISATINIFITGGRTGYLTFVLLVLVLSIFYLKRWAIVALLAVVFVFFTAYNFSPIFQEKVLTTEHSIIKLFDGDADFSTSIGQRAGIYYYAMDVLKEHPVFGVGTGDSMNEIRNATPEIWHQIRNQYHEHNQFLSILIKLGFIGLFIFLNIYYQIFRYEQKDKTLRFSQIFTTLAIAFGILTTQFNLRFFMPLWVVMLAVTLINKERRTIVELALNDKKQMFQIVSAGVIFSILSLTNQLL